MTATQQQYSRKAGVCRLYPQLEKALRNIRPKIYRDAKFRKWVMLWTADNRRTVSLTKSWGFKLPCPIELPNKNSRIPGMYSPVQSTEKRKRRYGRKAAHNSKGDTSFSHASNHEYKIRHQAHQYQADTCLYLE